MKRLVILASLLATTSYGAIVTFDLSPPGTDNAVGLSPLNETSPVIGSSGSGNEIGAGISFNTETLVLNLSVGYGSAFGFSDLTGPASAAHIHGPAPTNVSAGVVLDLAGIHVPAANAAAGGSFVGSLTLTETQAAELLAGLYYINVHTPSNSPGEIRGQLIPVNTLPTLLCASPAVVECTGGAGTFASLTVNVADEDGDPLTVVWTVNGATLQTNTVPAGTTNLTPVTFAALYQLGTNSVTVSVSDGLDTPVGCATTVVVADTTPPVFTSASVSPNEIWPPNHKMIPVQVTASATDTCGSVVATRIRAITSNQSQTGKGSGKKSPDWQITGDLTALVRSERNGNGKDGRTYTIVIESVDTSGNAATTNVFVHVPHSQKGKNKPAQTDGAEPPADSQNGNGNANGNNGTGGKDKGKNK